MSPVNIVLFVFLCKFLLTGCISLSPEQGTRVHAFYYLWYGNPQHNGKYQHWDHEVLPHWESRINSLYPDVGKRFSPPQHLHSPYYPLLGPYSSIDPAVVDQHFQLLINAKVNVIVVSWWGQRTKSYATDTQGVNTDETFERLLDIAEQYNIEHPWQPPIQIAVHLEPYASRSVESVRDDIIYIHEKYGKYSCLYRMRSPRPKGFTEKEKIVFYVYDSYHIDPNQWQRLLYDEGDLSLRTEEEYDSVVLGLWLNAEHGRDLYHAGFDGIYTYFASDGFSYGSSFSSWRSICQYCRRNNMICDLSIGPGYDDTFIRPWNSHNSKSRDHGNYYRRAWDKAINAQPDFIRYEMLDIYDL
jgi:hypothetical protein